MTRVPVVDLSAHPEKVLVCLHKACELHRGFGDEALFEELARAHRWF
jgi:hypothetical protein